MKKYFFYIFLLAIILPWIIQYFLVYPNGFFETQYELNLPHLWSSITSLSPQFGYGQFGYGGYSRIWYLLSTSLGSFIFGKTYGILHIGLLLGIGFFGMYRLIRDYFGKLINEKHRELISCLASFVFITSPSIFFYFKSTIALTAPAIIFPLQLLFVFFIIENKKKFLSILLLIISFLLITYANITVILLNIFFLILITCLYFPRKYLKIFITVILSSAPTLLFIILITGISMKMSYTPTGGIMETIREDFYSNQTSILQIFKQTAEWAFFGWSSEGLYYDFSLFYGTRFMEIVGGFFGFGLLIFSVFSKNKYISFQVILLILVAFMLGNKFIIYDFLYHNFVPFQLFRNIQKFAPFFLFLLLILGVLRTYGGKRIFLLYLFLLSGIVYNIPYFSYSNTFVRERNVGIISSDWEKTIKFINKNISDTSKILLAPAVYINEIYNFQNTKYLVGIMTDHFTDIKGYRLSPILNGDYFIQKKMGELFIPGNTINGKKVDISKIEDFLDKFYISHILITKDVIQNYENAEEYIKYFDQNEGYVMVYKNQSHIIYQRKKLNGYSFVGKNIVFQFNKFGNVSLNINLSGSNNSFTFLEGFHPGWNFYLEPFSKIWCSEQQIHTGVFKHKIEFNKLETQLNRRGNNFSGGNIENYLIKQCKSKKEMKVFSELNKFSQKPIFENTHHLVNGYANGRTLDADYIKQNFPKEYYKENPDGSIDVNLTLYFKPQSYFYLGLGVSGLTFLGLIAWLIIEWRREKKALSQKTDEN